MTTSDYITRSEEIRLHYALVGDKHSGLMKPDNTWSLCKGVIGTYLVSGWESLTGT